MLLNTTTTGATTVVFGVQQTFAAGNLPSSVAVADFNGDGKQARSQVAVQAYGYSVSVLVNTTGPISPTPTFTAQQTFSTGKYPGSVAVADVNGDGKPDLIVANNASVSKG